ncbi:MAG: MotA/TolQ/ExbB proton channel family protein [Myxococcota bacterium]
MTLTDRLAHFFESIGADWVLYILLVLFLLSLLVMVERILFFRKNRVDPVALSKSVIQAVRNGGPQKAREQLAGVGGMTGGVLSAALDAWDDGVDAVEEVVAAAIGRERILYDKWLPILGTLGNAAPFIGLFGTVIGILTAFSQLAGGLQGAELKAEVMKSIGEALVATAVGLAVAIPSVVGFNAFKSRIKRMASDSDGVARLLLAHLKARRATDPAAKGS